MHRVFLFAILRAFTGALGDKFSSGIRKERKKTKENLHERGLQADILRGMDESGVQGF